MTGAGWRAHYFSDADCVSSALQVAGCRLKVGVRSHSFSDSDGVSVSDFFLNRGEFSLCHSRIKRSLDNWGASLFAANVLPFTFGVNTYHYP